MNPSDFPDDPAGTVRVSPSGGTVAVRGHANEHDELVWWFIDCGDTITAPPDITDWPIVRGVPR